MSKSAILLLVNGIPVVVALLILLGTALCWFGIGGERLGRFLLWAIIGIILFMCLAALFLYLLAFLYIKQNTGG
jgi:hypothetical protein